MKFAKVSKPSTITLFVSEKWKYGFFSKLKKTLEKTRNIGEVIKACIGKEHQKEISKMIPSLIKNEGRIPKIILDQNKELKNLEENIEVIKKQFNCSVEIIKAEDSDEVKSKQAIPSKPAVLVK